LSDEEPGDRALVSVHRVEVARRTSAVRHLRRTAVGTAPG